jgi:hypothetical protein
MRRSRITRLGNIPITDAERAEIDRAAAVARHRTHQTLQRRRKLLESIKQEFPLSAPGMLQELREKGEYPGV